MKEDEDMPRLDGLKSDDPPFRTFFDSNKPEVMPLRPRHESKDTEQLMSEEMDRLIAAHEEREEQARRKAPVIDTPAPVVKEPELPEGTYTANEIRKIISELASGPYIKVLTLLDRLK